MFFFVFIVFFIVSVVLKVLGLEKFFFVFFFEVVFDLLIFWKFIVLGIIFGMVGGVFVWCLKLLKRKIGNRLKNFMIRIVIIGVCFSVLFFLFYKGRYLGLGINLI